MTDTAECQIILASASPRRKQLLQQIALAFRVHVVALDESIVPGESAVEHATRLALAKAMAAHNALQSQGQALPVLGADTVVEIDNVILGKPNDTEHATQMLTRLSGKQHTVHTAVAVVTAHAQHTAISSSSVQFAALDAASIQNYIATGEGFDKAGGYAIQGIAGQFIRSMSGSYSGIMGLPLYETTQLLASCGVRTLTNIKMTTEPQP